MDRAKRERLRELAQAATPGPWEAAHAAIGLRGVGLRITEHYVRRPGDDVAIACDIVDPTVDEHAPSETNAAYIAAAHPSAMLALLDTIEQLERERDAARDQVREMGEHSDTCTYHMLGRQVCSGCRCGRAQDSTAAQEGAGDASR